MPKLRVLFDATLAANPAGSGTFTRGVLAALRQREDLEVVTSALSLESIQTLDNRRKGPASRAASSLAHLRYYLTTLPRAARRAGADVIYCPSSLVPWQGRTPLVMTVYDLTVERYPETLDRVSRWYLGQMLKVGMRRARALCTISNAVAGELRGRAGSRPIVVAYPGPSSDLLNATATAVEAVTPPFVLMVGTIEPRKNHVTALRALAAHRERRPESRLSLVISGSPGWRYDEVLTTIDRLQLADRVHRLGALQPGALRWLYEHARGLLFPSLYEGFGLPVLDASILHCPVVASDIGSVREIVGGTGTPLLPPQDVEQWTEAIDELASGSAPINRLEAAAARGAHFTWQACAASVAEALRLAVA
ncbi:MAG TPA: glycosyltransferase family 1 protein [Candidatus Dormibacteraeota bacterium]